MNKETDKSTAVSSLRLKAYTPLQLSVIYEVSKKTFNKWLAPFADQLGDRMGHYYSVRQVQIIIAKLGFPGILLEE